MSSATSPWPKDPQTPHARNEVYLVLSGKARIQGRGSNREIEEGDLLVFFSKGPIRKKAAVGGD